MGVAVQGAEQFGPTDQTALEPLRIEALSVDYGAQRALDHLTFEVRPAEVHCLLGANGSGKSTALKALAGVVPARSGYSVSFGDGSVTRQLSARQSFVAGVRFVHQDLALLPELTIFENIFLGNGYPKRFGAVQWPTARRRIAAMLDRLAIAADPLEIVANLPVRDRVLVATGRALLTMPRMGGFVFADEPTATLGEADAASLLGTFRDLAQRNGIGVCLITHRLREVQAFADRVTVLSKGRVVLQAPTKAVAPEDLLNALGAFSLDVEHRAPTRPVGSPVAEFRQVRGRSLRGVDLEIHAGEIVGVTGVEGSGKEELADITYGLTRPASGAVFIHGLERKIRTPVDARRLGIGMVPARRVPDGGIAELPVQDNILLASYRECTRRHWFRRRYARAEAQRLVNEYGVDPPEVNRRFDSLSGGNQQKAIAARWLSTHLRLLVLAEPTAGIDAVSQRTLHARLQSAVEAGLAVLLISSDVEELAALSSRVAVLVDGAVEQLLVAPDITPAALVRASFGEPTLHESAGALG